MNLLLPGGRLVIIKGYWHNSGGLHAQHVVDVLPKSGKASKVRGLSDKPELWGGTATDEGYMAVAEVA